MEEQILREELDRKKRDEHLSIQLKGKLPKQRTLVVLITNTISKECPLRHVGPREARITTVKRRDPQDNPVWSFGLP